MELYLVRHGEAEDDIRGTIGGEMDDPLTERGREQARALARRLASLALDAIYASPLIRARETADILAAGRPAAPVIEEGLAEKRLGVLAGLPRAEAKVRYPQYFGEGARDLVPPGAESYEAFFARVKEALGRIRAAHSSDGAVLVVSHGGPVNVLLQDLLGIDLARFPLFSLGDTSLSHLTVHPDRAICRFVNSTRHLPTR